MVCAIYVRKSVADEKSLSMETQKQMCIDYIKIHFQKSQIKIYDNDYGITGHSTAKRKDFQRMIKDIKDGKIDAVLVQRYDRLNRNMRDFCNTYHVMEEHNCVLVSVSQDIDTSTPYGRKFMYDMASTSELEWALNSERRKDINNYAASIGKFNLSDICVPVGYKPQKIDGIRRLVFDDEKKPIIEEMINYLRSGGSRSSVPNHINSIFNTKYTSNLFRTFASSSFYYGSYKGNPNFCPAYLSKEELEKLTRPVKQRVRVCTDEESTMLFTSLIRCPFCNRTMESSIHKYVSKKTKIYRYYRCFNGSHIKNLCNFNTLIKETYIENYLISNIDKELKNFTAEIKSKNKKTKKNNKLNNLIEEQKRLNLMFQKGRITEDEYDEEYFKLTKLIDDEKENTEPARDPNEVISKFPSNWLELYEKLSRNNKKRFWISTIKEIVIDENGTVKKIIFL